jgi:hypothetical protein
MCYLGCSLTVFEEFTLILWERNLAWCVRIVKLVWWYIPVIPEFRRLRQEVASLRPVWAAKQDFVSKKKKERKKRNLRSNPSSVIYSLCIIKISLSQILYIAPLS